VYKVSHGLNFKTEPF